MGYRIDIDHSGCITCGICMDVCPVEALDMSRPQAPGVESGPGPGQPLPWMMEHPLQVGECIGCGICIGECPPNVMSLVAATGDVPLAVRQGPIDRPADTEPGAWIPLSAVTREALKPVHDSPWGDLFTWRTRSRPQPWQVWTTMVEERVAQPDRPLPGGVPGGHRRRAIRRADRRGPLRRGLRGGGRGQSVPVRVRLDLHRAMRDRVPTRRAGRADRDPDAQAIRGRARHASEGRAALAASPRARGDRRRRARGHVGGVVSGPPRLRRHRARGDARARRHDGDRHPRVSTAARCAPGGDRPDPRGRGRAAAGHGDGPRLRPGRPRARGVQGDLPRDRRVEEPTVGGPRGRAARGHPRDPLPQGGQPRGVAPPVRRRRRRRRRQHGHGRGAVGPPERRGHRHDRLSTRARATCPPSRRRSRRPSARASPSSRASRRPRSSGATRPSWPLRCNVLRADDAAGADGRATWSWTGETRELPATAILVAIGEEPDPSILPEGAGIEVSGWAGIVADPRTLATGRAGIFAGGDVVSGPRTIIEAVAAGRRAAASIHEHLAGVRDGEAEILAAVRYSTRPEASLTARPRRASAGAPALPVVDIGSFSATALGYTDADADAEAGRCFRCDAVYGCPSVQVVAGRGPADGHRAPGIEAMSIPAAVPADQPVQGGVQ